MWREFNYFTQSVAIVPLFVSPKNHFGGFVKTFHAGETGLNDWKIEHKAVRQRVNVFTSDLYVNTRTHIEY